MLQAQICDSVLVLVIHSCAYEFKNVFLHNWITLSLSQRCLEKREEFGEEKEYFILLLCIHYLSCLPLHLAQTHQVHHHCLRGCSLALRYH